MRRYRLLKRLIFYNVVKIKIKYNKQIFKFLFFRKRNRLVDNKFQQLTHNYAERLTIDKEGWDYLLENIDAAIFHIPKDDILPLIEMLLFNGFEEQAQLLIRDYSNFYGTEGLKHQIKTQQYCQQNGYCQQTTNPISAAFDQLRENSTLLDLVKNKTVAIVGSGPSELGTGNGQMIDQHDFVLRFNTYRTKGFESDYGTRTDIWVYNCCRQKERRTEAELESFKLIILEQDLYRDTIRSDAYEILSDMIKNHSHKIVFVERENKERLVDSLDSYPSSGMITIDLISAHTKISIDNVFGFSFKQKLSEREGKPDHYYDREIPENSRHDYNRESLLIKSMLS